MCEEEERERREKETRGPEQWFSKWERQCLSEADKDSVVVDRGEERRGEEDEEEDAERRLWKRGEREEVKRRGGEGEEEDAERRLWYLFQNSATAVAQLYKERVCPQQTVALWVPFQNAATAVTNLYKESVSSYESGVQSGLQRRRQEVLSWATKRRRVIRREELISFLCGKKTPPLRSRVAMVMPNHTPPSVTSPAPSDTDLTPFTQAIALHGLSGAMAGISVCTGASPHLSSSSVAPPCGHRRNCTLQQDTTQDLSSPFTTHQDMTSHTQDVTSHATTEHREHAHQPMNRRHTSNEPTSSLHSSNRPMNSLHSSNEPTSSLHTSNEPTSSLHTSNRPMNSLHSSHQQPMACHVEHTEPASLRKRPSEPSQPTADSLTHKRHRLT